MNFKAKYDGVVQKGGAMLVAIVLIVIFTKLKTYTIIIRLNLKFLTGIL